MRINRNMSAVITNNQLKRTENRLAASMERLSSGLKLNHASDNPAGMAISNKMKAQIDALDQAESNASDGISVLQIADGALNEVSSILQRMRELSVQAANGTNEYEDRKSIQEEIAELQKEVERISTDTEFNTKTLLDGSSDVRVYAEDASRIYVSDTVDPANYRINVTEMGKQASVDLAYPNVTKDENFSINGVAVDITPGMSEDDYLAAVRDAAEEAGCIVEDVVVNGNKYIRVKSEFYGTDEEVNIVLSDGLAREFGIQNDCEAQYVSTEFEISYPAGEEGVVELNGVRVSVYPGMTEEAFEEAIAEAAQDTGCTMLKDDATGKLIIRTQSASKTAQLSVSTNLVAGLGLDGKQASTYAYHGHGEDAVVTLPTDLDQSKFTPTTTVDADGNRIKITDGNGFEIDFLLDEDYQVANADAVNGNYRIEVTDLGAMTIQIGANEYQTMDVRISEISSESLYIDTIDVSKKDGGDRAMETLDDAIAKLSSVRSRIGAFQNRLEYASSSLASTQENVTAAYSSLTDTDMAEEMTEYTQQNILDQAAVSVLAQANDLPEQVLSLLR